MKNDGNSGNSNSNHGRHTRAGEAMPPELSGKSYFVFLTGIFIIDSYYRDTATMGPTTPPFTSTAATLGSTATAAT